MGPDYLEFLRLSFRWLWRKICWTASSAGVAQLVELLPSKQVVAGSNPVSRSIPEGVMKPAVRRASCYPDNGSDLVKLYCRGKV